MLRRILICLGALVAILPYLGLPRSWDNALFTLCGLLVVILLVVGKRPRAQENFAPPIKESVPKVLPNTVPRDTRGAVPAQRFAVSGGERHPHKNIAPVKLPEKPLAAQRDSETARPEINKKPAISVRMHTSAPSVPDRAASSITPPPVKEASDTPALAEKNSSVRKKRIKSPAELLSDSNILIGR